MDLHKQFRAQPGGQIMTAATYVPGTLVVTADELATSEETWDTLRLTVWATTPHATPGHVLADALPPIGTELADMQSVFDEGYPQAATARWFYQGGSLRGSPGAGQCCEGELIFKGVHDTSRPYKLAMDSASVQFDAENATISDGYTTYGPKPKLRTNVPEVTLTAAYPIFNAPPATDTVGQQVGSMPLLLESKQTAPPYLPAIRSWFASVEGEITWQWPNGWHKEGMEVDCLLGVSPAVAHFVRDRWRFSFEKLAG